MRGRRGPNRDTEIVLGTEFMRTLRAAQAGEEDAFARLWRDANPAMIRYLRVVGHDDPYDEACEGWITVVRGLPGFVGDELAWRVWLLACARQRAEESTLRRAWGSVTVLPGIQVEGDGELDIDELLESDAGGDPVHRGINDTLTALRALPLGQGEVVVLHLGAGLPPSAVADVVGVDQANIERAESRALERLATDADLLAWSLAAPPTPAELADEHIALSAFRKIPSSARRSPGVKVIAIGLGSAGAATAAAAGRSRTALLTATALSVSVMSLGGLGAAAYVGALPDPVQQVLHDTVGAPAPEAPRKGTSPDSGSNPATPSNAGVGPHAAGSPAAGLCRAWASDKAKGTARDRSVAFRNLAGTAGGTDRVEAYCAGVLAAKPTKGSSAPTARVIPSAKPTHPTKPSTTKTPSTKTPAPHSPATHDPNPNPNSTKSAAPPAQGKSAKAGTSSSAPSDPATTGDREAPNPRSSGKGVKTGG